MPWSSRAKRAVVEEVVVAAVVRGYFVYGLF